MAKYQLRIEAQKLRSQGESIKEIAQKLKVSSGSVSVWCKDIILTPEQILSLQMRAKDPFYGKRLSHALAQREAKIKKIRHLKEQGIKKVGMLSKRELFLTGVALYWAEGFKKDKQVGFANSDPYMILLFIHWLKICFNYDLSDLSFRVTANISHEYRIHQITYFWSELLKVSPENFQKPFFQKIQWQKVYENPTEYYGILRIKVRKSTDFLRLILGYIEGLKLNSS